MARIILSDNEIRIELSLWEKVLGLMGNRTIPRSAITEVALENDPLGATRGLRALDRDGFLVSVPDADGVVTALSG